jgi:hypothetical protein
VYSVFKFSVGAMLAARRDWLPVYVQMGVLCVGHGTDGSRVLYDTLPLPMSAAPGSGLTECGER